ncbi:MAG: SBBP repeat-containing protein [Gammaproteobacteria bacterium]
MRTMKRWACFGHAVGKETSRLTAARWAYRIGRAGLALLLVSGAPAAPGAEPDTATKARVEAAFGQLPLLFIENRGQLDPAVAYYVQGRSTSLYFAPGGLTFVLSGTPDPKAPRLTEGLVKTKLNPERTPERWALKLDFLGTNPNVKPVAEAPQEAVISYFKGPPSKQQAGLKTYATLRYPDLWPGIDLVYSGTVNRMKYHFVVKPGADPRTIRLAYRGTTGVQVSDAGRLEVVTPLGNLQDDRPVSYQEVNGKRVEVTTDYALEPKAEAGSHAYGFKLGDYDHRRPLVLDPAVFVYAGYIGGDDSDGGFGIAVDKEGNAYVTGGTSSTEASFPVKGGPDLTFNGGFQDAFVAKVNASGTALVYAGYIGGNSDDLGFGIAVDKEGNAYVTGGTSSTEASFPVKGGPDLTFNGDFDAFVAKVNASGTALVYAGYIGGDRNENGVGIAVDKKGNAYVTGSTFSTEASFPVKKGPDLTFNGGFDAFVAKVNASGTALVYAGYIGGDGDDGGRGIAVDKRGNAYVTGAAGSTEASFPVKVGPDLTFSAFDDTFVAKVHASGTALVYAGYIGGDGFDEGFGIAVDKKGNAYVTGETRSTEATFPVKGGPDLTFNGDAGDPGGGGDAFVAKVNASGTALVYAGYIGGNSDDLGFGIAVDKKGNAYVTGLTSSTEASFPVKGGARPELQRRRH